MDKEGKQAEMTRLSCHRFRLNSGEQNNKPVRSCACRQLEALSKVVQPSASSLGQTTQGRCDEGDRAARELSRRLSIATEPTG